MNSKWIMAGILCVLQCGRSRSTFLAMAIIFRKLLSTISRKTKRPGDRISESSLSEYLEFMNISQKRNGMTVIRGHCPIPQELRKTDHNTRVQSALLYLKSESCSARSTVEASHGRAAACQIVATNCSSVARCRWTFVTNSPCSRPCR